MVQHELLMVVAAPLLVLGRPLEAWTWALAPPWRVLIGSWTRSIAARSAWRAFTEPVAAWSLHALALWAWHIPALFEAGLANEGVHILQHASFFVSALLFWSSVLGAARGAGAGVASVFTTMLHTGALGMLLTFAASPWYAAYTAGGTERFGLNALEDQQLGGLVMWIPAGLAYLAAGLALTWRAGWVARAR
jgi:putative membrane protein